MRNFAGILILACAILCSLPLASAQEKATSLRWKVPADKSLVFKLTTESVDVRGKAGLHFNLNDRSPMSYPLDCESEFILNSAPESLIDVAFLVKKFKFTPTNAEEREFLEQLRDSEDRVQIHASMSGDGRNQSFYLNTWQKNQLAMFLQLPENPVRPGDRWRVHFSFITIPVEYNFRCEKSERLNEAKLSALRKTPQGELIAVIDYNLRESITGSMPNAAGQKQAVSSTVTFEGIGEFSVDKGRWNKFNGRFHYEYNFGLNGAADVNVDLLPVESNKKVELCATCGEVKGSSKCCVVAPKKAAAAVVPPAEKTAPEKIEKSSPAKEAKQPAVVKPAEEKSVPEESVEFGKGPVKEGAKKDLVVKTGPKEEESSDGEEFDDDGTGDEPEAEEPADEKPAAEKEKVAEEEKSGEEAEDGKEKAVEEKPAVEKIEKVSLIPTPVGQNVEVSFPDGWDKVDIIPGKKVIVFAPMQNERRFREYVEVGIENLEADMDLLKYSSRVITEFGQVQEAKFFHRGDVQLGKLAAKWFMCNYKKADSNVRAIGYTMIKDGKGYTIVCVSSADRFDALKPLFEEIARSFAIVE